MMAFYNKFWHLFNSIILYFYLTINKTKNKIKTLNNNKNLLLKLTIIIINISSRWRFHHLILRKILGLLNTEKVDPVWKRIAVSLKELLLIFGLPTDAHDKCTTVDLSDRLSASISPCYRCCLISCSSSCCVSRCWPPCPLPTVYKSCWLSMIVHNYSRQLNSKCFLWHL